jgi:hypothetical protein
MYQDPDEGDFIGVFCFRRDIKRGAESNRSVFRRSSHAGNRESSARIARAWWFARQGQ